MEMDPLFMAQVLFRHRRFQDCIDACEKLLEKNPTDQAAWFLKVRSLTEQTYVDEVEVEEEGIAELMMDENAIADVARPGTSLRRPATTAARGTNQGIRPLSQAGRPVSGFLRPGTQTGKPSSMEQAIKAPRTAMTARPITSASGRFVRLGTASMLTEPGGPFIDVSKINLAKYAERPVLAKVLFDYLFYHESNIRSALQLAAMATEACKFEDWWWKVQLGKCYYRLGMYRDAEGQFQSALRTSKLRRPHLKGGVPEFYQSVDMYLYLCKVYVKLDQPLKAVEYYRKGLEKFPNDSSLLVGIARIQEGLNDTEASIACYREVLKTDSTNMEAIACIGTHHFYNDQPEIALRYYRRLLQVGVYNAELFNNLGLCCFYSQQYDMSVTCFQRALQLASTDALADTWYNIGNVALAIGDGKLAYHCFKLALVHNNNLAEAFNNLGVLEWQNQRGEQALACFQTASKLAQHFYEPHYNFALACEKIGRLQSSYSAVKLSLDAYPDHLDSKELMKQLEQHFAAL